MTAMMAKCQLMAQVICRILTVAHELPRASMPHIYCYYCRSYVHLYLDAADGSATIVDSAEAAGVIVIEDSSSSDDGSSDYDVSTIPVTEMQYRGLPHVHNATVDMVIDSAVPLKNRQGTHPLH
jgi:hypothetical protein